MDFVIPIPSTRERNPSYSEIALVGSIVPASGLWRLNANLSAGFIVPASEL
jgi:hypothetical protein